MRMHGAMVWKGISGQPPYPSKPCFAPKQHTASGSNRLRLVDLLPYKAVRRDFGCILIWVRSTRGQPPMPDARCVLLLGPTACPNRHP